MNRTVKLATVTLIAVAAALALLLIFKVSGPVQTGTSGPETALADENELPTGALDTPSDLTASEPVDIPEQLPVSLKGTNVPSGWARTDANGSLIPTPQLRQLFEYYLAALGEETLAQLVARIRQALDSLPEPARSEAVETLGAYLDYKLALGEMEPAATGVATLDPDALAQQFADIRSLRRRWLDADTAEAFFAMEEAVDEFQLAQKRIRADDSLSDEARAERLRQAEQSLPEPLRQAREQTRKFSDYQQVRQKLADDPEALQAWRQEAFGAEAAGRLAREEAEQRAWKRRWQAYQSERAELDRLGLVGPELEAATSRLREKHFDGPERHRAEALESLQ